MENKEYEKIRWLDKPVVLAFPRFSWEKLIVAVIILLAVISRFYMVGERVMSHDEVNHVVPAYNLYKGSGYAHDPVTHGPFQFHLLALSYFILGDSDFAARVPAALFSIAAVIAALFCFRRYLGRVGSLAAGLFFLISPFILFYGRYTRNEAFIELFSVLTFYGFMRYLEKRDDKSLYLLSAVTALQFVTKEVSYIYTAQFLLFCGFMFLLDLWKIPCQDKKERYQRAGMVLIAAAVALSGLALLMLNSSGKITTFQMFPYIIAGLIIIALLFALFIIIKIIRSLTWGCIRQSAYFNLTIFVGALILPQLTAFPVKMLGFDPLDYSSAGMRPTGIALAIMFILSFAIGIWWNRRVFLKSAAIFYVIFILFYTTIFSNGQGFFTGIIGSLGYWLSQHEVQRGGQPAYYYGLILLPVYEFAALAGTVLAIYFGIRHKKFASEPGFLLSLSDVESDSASAPIEAETEMTEKIDSRVIQPDTVDVDPEKTEIDEKSPQLDFVAENIVTEDTKEDEKSAREALAADALRVRKIPVLSFFLFWSISALIAYSIAGEKMPWLAVHITIPFSLCAAWGIGYLIETAPWDKIRSVNGWGGLISLLIGIAACGGLVNSLHSAIRPFSGKELSQLKSTYQFVLSLVILIIVIMALIRLWKKWSWNNVLYQITLFVMALLMTLEARTAFTASFINYDYANELLVYAHAGPGPKIVLRQIEEIGARTGQGKTVKVAYDNDGLYPYWWYFRDYPAKNYFGEANPTRELRNSDVIILNTSKEGRMEPIVRDNYYRYEYIRLWWPNQDYWYLTPARVIDSFRNPAMRAALFDIWLNRDYTKYATVIGRDQFTKQTWEPAARMAVFMKKDLLRQMWQLGDETLLAADNSQSDFPEDEKFSQIDPVTYIGAEGTGEGMFKAPRGVAISPDGSTIYVADTDNNRVQYFTKEGQYLGTWNATEQGGLKQPWGIAVGPDGNVYVADTWNHRMMKFTADGKYLLQWNVNDGTATNRTFYGPRSIAVSSNNIVYVSDTGNKRIVVFDEMGAYLSEFGFSGMGIGEFDEPVGITLINDNKLAVADTWNQRVQIFDVSQLNGSYPVLSSFTVPAWYSQSLDNKPYIAADQNGDIYFSDPEGYLIWQYKQDGALVRSWNGGGGNIDSISMPTGLAFAPDGSVWVVNTKANRLARFLLPPLGF